MSSKEAMSVMPKLMPGENITAYTKKIKTSWNYCKAEGLSEDKFCQLLRLYVPQDVGFIIDNLEEKDQNSVDAITLKILSTLGPQKSEYLQELSSARKTTNESYMTFALRLQRLYLSGTGQDTLKTNHEQRILCEKFLNGLKIAESTALRLAATETELQDLTKLAKRAARCLINHSEDQEDQILVIEDDVEYSDPGDIEREN